MIVSVARAGLWQLAQAARADTVLIREVGTKHTWFETAAALASSMLTIALLVLTMVMLVAAWKFWKGYQKIQASVGHLSASIAPLLRHTHAISDNVNFITTSVRADVAQVNAMVASASERLQQAVAVAEQRLNEFNALIEVVQQEAEGMFVATASTVRGVRTGAAALHHEDDDEDIADDFELSEDLENGSNDPSASQPGTTRPRVRPRRRGIA